MIFDSKWYDVYCINSFYNDVCHTFSSKKMIWSSTLIDVSGRKSDLVGSVGTIEANKDLSSY